MVSKKEIAKIVNIGAKAEKRRVLKRLKGKEFKTKKEYKKYVNKLFK